jgi:transposase-like protein
MKASDFQEWLKKISQLSRSQKEQARHCLGEVAPQAAVVKWLEDSFEPSYPACQASRPYRWGYQAGLQHFRCRACKHTFTAVSGTLLIRLRYKEQWLNYSAALIEGLTVRASAKPRGIDKNTSFRWHHRFLVLPVATKANRLQGIVEADETFFPSSCKGQPPPGPSAA